MAIEKNGQMTYVDAAGNEYLLFPKTKAECVEGLTPKAVGAAPAGYGLGEVNGKYVSDCYAITKPGFYYTDGNTLNSPFPDGCVITANVEHQSYGRNIYLFATYCELNAQCYYSDYTKEWQPWEYGNPPMIPGVEYRTTKRHNGKVVFTQFIDFGALPSNGQKNLDISAPNFESLISATVSAKVIQTGRDVNKDITRLAVYHNSIEVTTEKEMGQDAEITIEYTKSVY